MNLRKKVLIIEDDEFLRNSLTLIINGSEKFRVMGAFGNYGDASHAMKKEFPDIILMDIELPGTNGIEATRLIKEKYSFIEIIIITIYQDDDMVFEALKAGASGYITKGINYVELLNALEEISRGGAPMSSRIARMVVNSYHVNHQSPLSARETQVLNQLAVGKTYTQIAEELGISSETSKTHIKNIYAKLHVSSKSEAIAKATQDKLI